MLKWSMDALFHCTTKALQALLKQEFEGRAMSVIALPRVLLEAEVLLLDPWSSE